MYCEKHDTKWYSDFLSECPICENEFNVFDYDAIVSELRDNSEYLKRRMEEFGELDGKVPKNLMADNMELAADAIVNLEREFELSLGYLNLLLPMAKAYAAQNQVGINQQIVCDVAEFLAL